MEALMPELNKGKRRGIWCQQAVYTECDGGGGREDGRGGLGFQREQAQREDCAVLLQWQLGCVGGM